VRADDEAVAERVAALLASRPSGLRPGTLRAGTARTPAAPRLPPATLEALSTRASSTSAGGWNAHRIDAGAGAGVLRAEERAVGVSSRTSTPA
jgi:hypothetical protein